ncbi:MAG: hypothetical protein U1E17_02555 [Geminicoccaceae bacterium]
MGRPAPLKDRLRHLAFALALAAGAFAVPMAHAETPAHGTAAHGAPAVEPGPAGGPGVKGFEEGVEAAEHGAGLPQLDVHTFASQIFWLILSFGTLYYLMSRKALPRLTEILEARQARIAGDLDRAARLRAEAEAAMRRHEQVVAEAQAKASAELKAVEERLSAEASKKQAAIEADLAKQLGEAEARIAQAKNAALAEIRSVAGEVAQAAVRRLAGIEVGEGEVKAALDKVLAEAA